MSEPPAHLSKWEREDFIKDQEAKLKKRQGEKEEAKQ